MIDITVKNIRATVFPGKTRAELDMTNAATRVSWGHGVVVEETRGMYGVAPAAYNLIAKGVRYAQPRIVKALAPLGKSGDVYVTLYINEEGGNERCRFVFQ